MANLDFEKDQFLIEPPVFCEKVPGKQAIYIKEKGKIYKKFSKYQSSRFPAQRGIFEPGAHIVLRGNDKRMNLNDLLPVFNDSLTSLFKVEQNCKKLIAS